MNMAIECLEILLYKCFMNINNKRKERPQHPKKKKDLKHEISH